MDFSTMKKKINQDEYSNILEFRADFELMCDNAMKYNRPETIYWQAAKKLPTLLADEEEDEELSPEEILSQAQQAAQCAREKLSLRRPISSYTLSCQRTNGTTSLRFVNQDDLSQSQSQTRTITIGELSNM